MATLLMRLAGPMQSWGTQSRFTIRDAGSEPSKSGVIGLLCAALGRHRSEPVGDLAALRFGVRVDREGTVKSDFHTAGGDHRKTGNRRKRGLRKFGVKRADGTISKDPVVSTRYYLADADFLVGLEGNDIELLKELDTRLARPNWPLYLGRKSFVSGSPVRIIYRPPYLTGPEGHPGIVDAGLREVLKSYPIMARTPRERERILKRVTDGKGSPGSLSLRLVLDAPFGTTGEVRNDVPLSFEDRRFMIRYVETSFIELSADKVQEVWKCTCQD